MTTIEPVLILEGVAKTFTLHLREGLYIPVVDNVRLDAAPGECIVLGGPSGAGKSSILKMIYGNYRCARGSIKVHDGRGLVDVATALPREVMRLRQAVMSYVSQFLRVIPRVSTLDIVTGAAREAGLAADEAGARATGLLEALNLPRHLWGLPPGTFSGGEQQRVNIARGFAPRRPILLLDEPTASLDAANRAIVVDLIRERKREGVAIVGIFHDADVRDRVADRIVDVTAFAPDARQ